MKEMFTLLQQFLALSGIEAQMITGSDTDLFSMSDDDLLMLLENPINSARIFLYLSADERMELHFGSWVEAVEGADMESFAYLCSLLQGILSQRYYAVQISAGSLSFAIMMDKEEEKVLSAVLDDPDHPDAGIPMDEFLSLLAGQDAHAQTLIWEKSVPEEA